MSTLPVRTLPRVTAATAAAAVCALIGACAATGDGDAASGHTVASGAAGVLRGASVFVACETTEPAIRDVCTEQLAAEMTVRGGRPVRGGAAGVAPGRGRAAASAGESPTVASAAVAPPAAAAVPPSTAQSPDDRLLADARAAGARSVLLMSPTPVAVAEPGPALSIGIGSFGFGRGTTVGGGVGVTTPLGAPRVSTAFVGAARVIDVATGRTLWTARASAPPSRDLDSQLGSLAISLLDVADRDGLF